MGHLAITVGDDLHFTARWESAAQQTIGAIRRMLPIDGRLIHCRWSGESTWIPYGACATASKVGTLAANHFAMIVPDEGWGDRLREVGRRTLWEGAQQIRILEVED